jgi:hypothetical protein
LKGDFGAFTTLGAGYGEHLAWGSVAAASLALYLSGLAAFRAALRLVGIAFGTEELLVFSAEGKRLSAIGALKGLVLKSHWMTSSLKN